MCHISPSHLSLAHTSLQQWRGVLLMGAVYSGTWAISGARGEIHHEICLFPTVFLKRPTQLFVGPDQLQHLAGPPDLTVRVFAAGRRSIHTFSLRVTNS